MFTRCEHVLEHVNACGGRCAGGTATFTLLRSCWNVWALLLGASVHSTNPRGFASKFLTSVFALFSVVFLASYTANLAAFMIVQDNYFNFSGFDDPRVRCAHCSFSPSPHFCFATLTYNTST